MAICIGNLSLRDIEIDIAYSDAEDNLDIKLTTPEETISLAEKIIDLVDKQLQDGDPNQSLSSYLQTNTDKTSPEYVKIMEVIGGAFNALNSYRSDSLTGFDFEPFAGDIDGVFVHSWSMAANTVLNRLAALPVKLDTPKTFFLSICIEFSIKEGIPTSPILII